jgi:hypothetical protein
MERSNEISENTVVGLSLRTVGMIIGAAIVVTLGYFDLKAGVEEAKTLPAPVISRTEFDLKDELIRETIMNTQTDVGDIKTQLARMEQRLFEMK